MPFYLLDGTRSVGSVTPDLTFILSLLEEKTFRDKNTLICLYFLRSVVLHWRCNYLRLLLAPWSRKTSSFLS